MSISGDAYAALNTALADIPGARVYRFEQAAQVIPGGQGMTAVLVGPADPLSYRTYGNHPTDTVFKVLVVVGWGTEMLETLLDAVEAAVPIIHEALPGCSVSDIAYGLYAGVESQLPMYELTVVTPLQA